MHPILILLSLFVFAGCLPNPESIKEEVYEQQRADYLALRNFDDKRAVDAFDHYFDANQFRRKYWIHMSATPTNGFWWYPVKDPLGSPRYTCWLKPATSLVPSLDNGIFRIRTDAPIMKDNADEALRAGYISLENTESVEELATLPTVIASRDGRGAEDMWCMTAVIELKGELFALSVMTREKYRTEVVEHVADLTKSARPPDN